MSFDEQVEAEEWVVSGNLKLFCFHLIGKLARHTSPRDLVICLIYESLHLYVLARICPVPQNKVIRIFTHLLCHFFVLRIVNV